MTTAMRGTAQQRLGTAMKSNAAVGYKSKPVAPDGKSGGTSGPAPPLESKKDRTEEENFKEMEEEVHRLLETSADGKVKKNFNDALIKAKEAAAKEKKIRQLREQNNSLD
jgi:intraflagellar transport protein 88